MHIATAGFFSVMAGIAIVTYVVANTFRVYNDDIIVT